MTSQAQAPIVLKKERVVHLFKPIGRETIDGDNGHSESKHRRQYADRQIGFFEVVALGIGTSGVFHYQ